jgi:hypothetical protein
MRNYLYRTAAALACFVPLAANAKPAMLEDPYEIRSIHIDGPQSVNSEGICFFKQFNPRNDTDSFIVYLKDGPLEMTKAKPPRTIDIGFDGALVVVLKDTNLVVHDNAKNAFDVVPSGLSESINPELEVLRHNRDIAEWKILVKELGKRCDRAWRSVYEITIPTVVANPPHYLLTPQ